MDSVEISRFLTGMTLAVHIIFATVGVGMPLMFAIAEFLGIKNKDPNGWACDCFTFIYGDFCILL